MTLPAACKCGHIPAIQSVDQRYPMTDGGRIVAFRKDYRVTCHRCGAATPWKRKQFSCADAIANWNDGFIAESRAA